MTVETHGMRFELDASGVAKGFRDYKSAVEGIFGSLDKFEQKVAKTMKGVESAASNKAALTAFRKSVEGFSKIDIDATAAKKLSALSAAMGGFKAPSAAQAQNTRKFFTSLQGLPDMSEAFRSIKALSSLKSSMEGFKAPPLQQAKNLKAFADAIQSAAPGLRSLNGIRGVSGIANELASISIALRNLRVPSAGQITNLGNLGLALRTLGTANVGNTGQILQALAGISGFRAPSPANIRNLVSFVNALANLKAPPNAGAIASSLIQIASAAQRANSMLGGFRTNLGGFNPAYGRFNSGTRQASIQLMGLQNAFSGTFQVGSALRTLLGSLTVGELGRNFFEAANAALQFKAQMSVLSKETGFADLQLKYINETANKFGVDMLAAEAGFAKISIAAHKSGMSVIQTRHVFEGFSTAMSVLGTTTAGQQDVWLALQQVMNKGYLSAEELNQQLNEKLPGAMAYAGEYAAKLGTTLEKGLKDKVLDADGVLAHIAKRMKEEFGPSVAAALERPSAQMNILKNNINTLFQKIGDSGVNQAIGSLLGRFNEALAPGAVDNFARSIGEGLANAVNKAAAAFDWLRENWDSIKGPLATTLDLLGKWMILSAGLQIGRMLVNPLIQLRAGLLSVSGALGGLSGMGGIFTRLGAGTQPLLYGLGALNIKAQASIVGMNALRVAGNATMGMFRGFSMLLGGPVGMAITAVTIGVGALISEFMSYRSLMASVQPQINRTSAFVQQLGFAALTTATNTASLGAEHQAAVTPINNFAGAVGGAAQQLWNMARAQRAANIERFKSDIQKLRGQRNELRSNSGSEWAAEGSRPIESAGQFGSWIVRGARIGLDNALTGGRSGDRNAAALAKTEKTLKELQADAMEYIKRPLEAEVNDAMRQIVAPQAPKVPRIGEDGKGTKGRKGPDPYKAMQTVENNVDALMEKLNAKDALGKLWTDFVETVSDESKVLLTLDGHKKFLSEVEGGAKNAQGITEALIKTLQSGAGLNDKTMTDLKKRYGTDVEGIIGLLRSQLADYQEAVAAATMKSIDQQYKGLIELQKKFAEFNPATKLRMDLTETMKPMAASFMSQPELDAWYRAMITGTQDAGQGWEALKSKMLDAVNPASTLHQQFKALNMTEAEFKQTIDAVGMSLADQTRQMQEAAIPAGKLLRQKREEIALLGVSIREANMLKELQEQVNERRLAKLPIDDQIIAKMRSEILATNDLLEQKQRERDFYENNGIKSYIRDLKEVGEVANDLDKNIMQSLEDTLFTLGTTGKLSFKGLFDTIQQGLIRYASQSLTKDIMGMVFGQDKLASGQASISGSILGLMGIKAGPGTGANANFGQKPDTGMTVDKFGNLVGGAAGGLQLGATAATPMYVRNADGVDPLAPLPETKPGATPVNPLFVKNADPTTGLPGIINPAGALPGAPGTALGDGQSVTGAINQAAGDKAQDATAKAAQGFGDSITGMLPMIGMMFAGSFKSPIAQIGVMFLTMMISKMMAANSAGGAGGAGGGGIGGMLGSVFSLFGGGSVPGALEGGIVGQFVNSYRASPAAFVNAPHYAEGTPNTSGGIPAILHDNEAVIPLSRGRKVPVELTKEQSGGNSRAVNVSFNVTSPDADSFRKSRSQVIGDLHGAASRAFFRDNR